MWYKCISNINGTLPDPLARHLQNEHVRNKRRVSTTGDHQAPRPFVQSDSSASLVADRAMRTCSTIITGRRNILKRSQKIGRSCNAEPQGCYINCWSIVVDRQIGIGKLSSRESKWKLSHIISPFNLSVSTQHVRVVRGNITHLLSTNTGNVPSNSGLFEVRSYRSYDETTQLPTNILEMGVTTYDIKWYNPDTVHIYLASTLHWEVYQVQIC